MLARHLRNSMKKSLSVAWLYPDLMSTYGDRGNIIVLQKRGEWRDIEVEIKEITLETQVKQLKSCDLLFMGGAQDRQQKIAGEDFLKVKGPAIKEMVEREIPGLFVCAGYQAVGNYYQPYQGDPILGPGIFDLVTKHPGDQSKRLIGNVVAEVISSQFSVQSAEINNKMVVGFENHGGRTYLGKKIAPFAKIIRGHGNNGEDGYEGAVYKNSIGSYFHGPLLPKNPQIADWLLKKALEKKYEEEIFLQKLDDTLEIQTKLIMISRIS